MRRLDVMGILCLAMGGCFALPPKLLRQDVQRLEVLAEQVDRRHASLCAAPTAAPFPPSTTGGEPPYVPPPTCAPLVACARLIREAGTACRDAIAHGASGVPQDVYRQEAIFCRTARTAARTRCAAAGMEVPPWP